jgi:hypothetical protein
VLKANQYLQSRKDFQEAGIRTYSDYQNMDLEDEAQSNLHWKALDENDLFWELDERERLIDFHDYQDEIMESEIKNASLAAQARLNKLKETGQFDLYPEVSFQNYKDIIRSIAITVLLSVVLVASPVFLRDRVIRATDLQYTAKTGRSLFGIKAAAGLISSLIVMTVILVVYLSLYSLNGPSVFFNVPINAFIGEFYWYNLTFFQYIVVTIIGIYLLGAALSLVAMGVSAVVPSYISLIGVQVPIVLALLIFGMKYLLDSIVSIWLPQWLVPGCYIVVTVMAAGFVSFLLRREKVLDIA